jgi:glucose-6-phosphate isomerase, archaeal
MKKTSVVQDFATGALHGSAVSEISRRLGDLRGVFRDSDAHAAMDPAAMVYRVQLYQPVAEGLEGGLFWGTTVIEPGLVGDEYFLTKGHFHAVRNRAEYYVTVAGMGALVLMTEDRHTYMETMTPGSVHYIPGGTAHRVANTGATPLSFLACWPSDAGHDYESIAHFGFSARVRRVEGEPRLVAEQ